MNLAALRGDVPPLRHNARTIAALAANPGCARRAVLDAAGIDKNRLAAYAGAPAPFGQSPFAIVRGKIFEASVKASGCAEILRLLREHLGFEIGEAAYDELADVGGNDTNEVRYARTRALLSQVASGPDDVRTMFDHPLLRINVGGVWAYLEPDLIAFKWGGRFHIIEIKSFAIIDGTADPAGVAAASIQSAVYAHALRLMLEDCGCDPSLVSHEALLVCPQDFSNRATLAVLDIRPQLAVLRRQLTRLTKVASIVERLPAGLSFDLRLDVNGVPHRPVPEIVAAIHSVDARYRPSCLNHCELSIFCRAESAGSTAALGEEVLEDLGGIAAVPTALALARGSMAPDPGQAEAAAALQLAHLLRQEALGGTG